MVRAIGHIQVEVSEHTPRRAARLFIETHGICPDLIEDGANYINVVGQCDVCGVVLLEGDAHTAHVEPGTVLCETCTKNSEVANVSKTAAVAAIG